MKRDWQRNKLCAFAATVSTGPFGSLLHKSDYVNNGVPLVNPTNIVGERIIPDPAKLIDVATTQRLSSYILKEGDIVVARRGEIGRCAVIGPNERGWICGTGSFFIRPLPSVDSRFLAYLIRSDEYRDKLEAASTGTTMKNLSNKALGDMVIDVPSLSKQRHIVSIVNNAFEGIATAVANAERSLQNSRDLFKSHLRDVFSQSSALVPRSAKIGRNIKSFDYAVPQDASLSTIAASDNFGFYAGRITKTGGREATLQHIPGGYSLAVGMPKAAAKEGWTWSPLSDLARLESGHTPSRRHPEYWGGSIPWIGIQDARENHGKTIGDTAQKTNELGIKNSSARVLPENTVCLSRTASVGYVVVMGQPMATSQDFVNWVCSDRLIPDFLKYLFLAEGRDGLLRYASGAIHQTIYFPEAKAFHVCHPGREEQLRIVSQCDALREESEHLESIYRRKLAALDELKKSLLHQAFSGQL